MSDIRFSCSSCGQSIEAPADMAGQMATCPNCKANIPVPVTVRRLKRPLQGTALLALIVGAMLGSATTYMAVRGSRPSVRNLPCDFKSDGRIQLVSFKFKETRRKGFVTPRAPKEVYEQYVQDWQCVLLNTDDVSLGYSLNMEFIDRNDFVIERVAREVKPYSREDRLMPGEEQAVQGRLAISSEPMPVHSVRVSAKVLQVRDIPPPPPPGAVPILVKAPDGTVVEFPAGTPDDVMTRVMRETFGFDEPPPAGAVPYDEPLPVGAVLDEPLPAGAVPYDEPPPAGAVPIYDVPEGFERIPSDVPEGFERISKPASSDVPEGYEDVSTPAPPPRGATPAPKRR